MVAELAVYMPGLAPWSLPLGESVLDGVRLAARDHSRTDGLASRADESPGRYDVRFEWGAAGAAALAPSSSPREPGPARGRPPVRSSRRASAGPGSLRPPLETCSAPARSSPPWRALSPEPKPLVPATAPPGTSRGGGRLRSGRGSPRVGSGDERGHRRGDRLVRPGARPSRRHLHRRQRPVGPVEASPPGSRRSYATHAVIQARTVILNAPCEA